MGLAELAVLQVHAEALARGPVSDAIRAIVHDLVTLVAARRELYRRWYAGASHLGRLDTGLEMTEQAVVAVRKALEGHAGDVRRDNLAFAADLVVKTALAMVRTGARDYASEMESGLLAAELSDMLVRYLLRDA